MALERTEKGFIFTVNTYPRSLPHVDFSVRSTGQSFYLRVTNKKGVLQFGRTGKIKAGGYIERRVKAKV